MSGCELLAVTVALLAIVAAVDALETRGWM